MLYMHAYCNFLMLHIIRSSLIRMNRTKYHHRFDSSCTFFLHTQYHVVFQLYHFIFQDALLWLWYGRKYIYAQTGKLAEQTFEAPTIAIRYDRSRKAWRSRQFLYCKCEVMLLWTVLSLIFEGVTTASRSIQR